MARIRSARTVRLTTCHWSRKRSSTTLELRNAAPKGGHRSKATAARLASAAQGDDMSDLTWVDYAQGVSAVATPVLVAVLAAVLARRQSRSHELLAARLDEYRRLIPDLNTLMCYITFIGDWKSLTPAEVVALKRRLDKNFFCAAPLFSVRVMTAYTTFIDLCFQTFNAWGEDARILTSAYRRRPAVPRWSPHWDRLFVYDDRRPIPGPELARVRLAYDELVAAIVGDIDITRARAAYTTSAVALNAHMPARADIEGSSDA